ncbi:MAG: hypothetical protein NC086_06910, partial [Alistipes sp.]|nr:hypothetical protein [Alistipes sp.]
MKKLYIICFLFLCAGAAYYFSYLYSKENLAQDNEARQAETESQISVEPMTNVSYNDIRINNLTVIHLQVYDLNNQTFTEEKINTPVAFLEMNRNDLIEYLNDYMKNPDKEDVKRGLVAYELVEFSREQVVIRKTFELGEEDNGYYAVLENGYVTIYCGDKSSVYDYTDIAA